MHKLPKEILLTLILFIGLCIGVFLINTTGDNGDSILHYLYSHEAFRYPSFFLHHWAKPLFVLLSSPFAYFGFKGLEIFNCLCFSLTALLTFYTARNLKLNSPFLVFLFLCCAPFCFKMIFSGLTEYLFALVLITGIYFSSLKQHRTTAIIISFLPMLRSEGLLILGVFAVYYLLNKKPKALLLLLFGQFIYSIAGWFYYKDFFWVFTKIPYANMGSPYGHGKWSDMAQRLNYVIEKPIYLLLGTGCLVLCYRALRNRFKERDSVLLMQVFATFIVFFIAHSFFWWKGIFNSMGLPRVFIGVMPLIALLALTGLTAITERINNPQKKILIAGLCLIIFIYPFSYRKQGVVYNKDLYTVPGNLFISQQLVPYIKATFPDHETRRLYYNAPYLSMALNRDHFDDNQHKDVHHILYDAKIPARALIIWDQWFSVAESGISLSDLQNNPHFRQVKMMEDDEPNGTTHYAIFEYKD